MQSTPASSYHVCKKHSEAAQQQNATRRQWSVRHQSCRNSGKHDNGHDLQGESAIIDEQPGQLTYDGSQHVHGSASALGRRATTAAARPTAKNSSANATIAKSAPGQA